VCVWGEHAPAGRNSETERNWRVGGGGVETERGTDRQKGKETLRPNVWII
jgi:hypothetical protein